MALKRILVLVVSIFLAVTQVHGATVNWVDATGFWDVATNWSSNPLLPGAGDDVIISVAGVQTITHRSGADTIRSLSMTDNILAVTGGSLIVTGGVTMSGSTINVDRASILAFQGDQTVGGTGASLLGGAASNRINIEGATTLTLGPSVVVRGQNGTIGNQNFVGGAANLTNNGIISADVAGGTIALQLTGSTANNATLSAQNGGTLVLAGSTVTNGASGHIDAGNGSTVVQSGMTISGGTINTTGTGALVPTNNGNNFLNAATLNGQMDLASSTGIERVTSGLTMVSGSTININNNSILAFQGDQTVGGTGTILLGSAASNRINNEGTTTLTLGPSVVVHGQNGTIGNQNFVGGTANLLNNGTIAADVANGTITITPTGAVTNNGLINAQAGTINIGRSVQGIGTLQVGASGPMNLQGPGPNATGFLVHNGSTPGSLNLGPNDITVSSDYTNANFGVGNAFNARANVAGTGQILASADVAQMITSANVTNGTSATPTLTIGNVHVGANTFNYQVTNTGTTGPSLRGATQTINGGNISDPQLGVTPQNWGPVVPGGSPGNLPILFTAASPGALSLQPGQVVHIANNFANVAAQNMNIVLGANAAAYNLAQATLGNLSFGNVLVNSGPAQQVLSVSNAAGPLRGGLNAALGAITHNRAGALTTNRPPITTPAGRVPEHTTMRGR